MKNTITRSIYLPIYLHKFGRAQAKTDHRSFSGWVMSAIRRHKAELESDPKVMAGHQARVAAASRFAAAETEYRAAKAALKN